jgi:sulfur relay (sulfurtransferase) complex TusBCD TusD component (DsrE family)
VKTLIVLSNPPYDGSDVEWNELRLAEATTERGHEVRLFLIND